MCGPAVWLEDNGGRQLTPEPGSDAVSAAAQLIAAGRIVAVKGIGGFHLACRGDSDDAVANLRERKGREAKPLAVMVAFILRYTAFGEPIGSFGLVKQKIGNMVVDCYATESAVQMMAALADRGKGDAHAELGTQRGGRVEQQAVGAGLATALGLANFLIGRLGLVIGPILAPQLASAWGATAIAVPVLASVAEILRAWRALQPALRAEA